MNKRLLSFSLALLIILSLTACNKENPFIMKNENETIYYFGEGVKEEFPDFDPIDVDKMYKEITYTEQMFYGKYMLNNEEEDLELFKENSSYGVFQYYSQYGDGLETETVSVLPYAINAGPAHVASGIRMDRTKSWAELDFATEDGGWLEVLCSFTVEGNKIKFTPVDYYEEIRDDDFNLTGIEYTLGEDSLEYSFSFSGPYMELTLGNESVTLCSYGFSQNTSSPSILAYKALDSIGFNEVDNITASIYDDEYTSVYLETDKLIDEQYPFVSEMMQVSDKGWLALYWQEEGDDGYITDYFKQFLYFGGYNGMTLVDEEYNVYYYTESYTSIESAKLTDGLTIEEALVASELSESELKEISEKKTSLLTAISTAFDKEGIKVDIDAQTGEIALDASVLFEGDSAVLTESGQDFLKKFLNAYTSVVFSEQYDGFISRIMVEGHTAPVSGTTYEDGLPLSEERANNVEGYCLSDDNGLNKDYIAELTSTLETVGYSSSKPIYDEKGEVDMEASRRVSFRFIVDLY